MSGSIRQFESCFIGLRWDEMRSVKHFKFKTCHVKSGLDGLS